MLESAAGEVIAEITDVAAAGPTFAFSSSLSSKFTTPESLRRNFTESCFKSREQEFATRVWACVCVCGCVGGWQSTTGTVLEIFDKKSLKLQELLGVVLSFRTFQNLKQPVKRVEASVIAFCVCATLFGQFMKLCPGFVAGNENFNYENCCEISSPCPFTRVRMQICTTSHFEKVGFECKY